MVRLSGMFNVLYASAGVGEEGGWCRPWLGNKAVCVHANMQMTLTIHVQH